MPSYHTQRLMEALGGQFGALIPLQPHQLLARQILKHAAGSRWTDTHASSHITSVGLLAVIGQEQNRMQIQIDRSGARTMAFPFHHV